MTTAALGLPQRAYQAIIGDLIDLALAQPHQVLLSTGSVALMAQFAAHGGVVDTSVGYCIAGGVEWAYLRGLASNAKAPTKWAAVLNWSAFLIVVLWGVLWVAIKYEAVVIAGVAGPAAWWLAAAHVVPVAWLSLCAAMTHSAAATVEAHRAEQERQAARTKAERDEAAARQREAEAHAARQAFDLAQAEKDAELRRWADAQRIKAELKVSQQVSRPVTQTVDTASHSSVTVSVDTHRAQAADILAAEPTIAVAELARRLNVSRAYLYKHEIGTKR